MNISSLNYWHHIESVARQFPDLLEKQVLSHMDMTTAQWNEVERLIAAVPEMVNALETVVNIESQADFENAAGYSRYALEKAMGRLP